MLDKVKTLMKFKACQCQFYHHVYQWDLTVLSRVRKNSTKYKEATNETKQLIMDNFVYILSFVPCIKDNKGILQSYTKPVLRT